jgi:hypothetical protein
MQKILLKPKVFCLYDLGNDNTNTKNKTGEPIGSPVFVSSNFLVWIFRI